MDIYWPTLVLQSQRGSICVLGGHTCDSMISQLPHVPKKNERQEINEKAGKGGRRCIQALLHPCQSMSGFEAI